MNYFSVLFLLLFFCVSAFAHGDENHGNEQLVEAGKVITRVLKIGDYEVLLKHPLILPDVETVAKIFLTKYETNEPVAASLEIEIEGDNGSIIQVRNQIRNQVGSYDLVIPALAEGRYKIRVIERSRGIIAVFPDIEVRAEAASAEKTSSNLVFFVVISLTCCLLAFYFVNRLVKDNAFGSNQDGKTN